MSLVEVRDAIDSDEYRKKKTKRRLIGLNRVLKDDKFTGEEDGKASAVLNYASWDMRNEKQ